MQTRNAARLYGSLVLKIYGDLTMKTYYAYKYKFNGKTFSALTDKPYRGVSEEREDWSGNMYRIYSPPGDCDGNRVLKPVFKDIDYPIMRYRPNLKSKLEAKTGLHEDMLDLFVRGDEKKIVEYSEKKEHEDFIKEFLAWFMRYFDALSLARFLEPLIINHQVKLEKHSASSKQFLYESVCDKNPIGNIEKIDSLIEWYDEMLKYDFITKHRNPRWDSFFGKIHTKSNLKLLDKAWVKFDELAKSRVKSENYMDASEYSSLRESKLIKDLLQVKGDQISTYLDRFNLPESNPDCEEREDDKMQPSAPPRDDKVVDGNEVVQYEGGYPEMVPFSPCYS